MPTYDYRCLDCRKRVSLRLSYREYDTAQVRCPHCGGANLKRRIQRVRVVRSEESRMDSLGDDDWGDIDEGDPRSIARAMRRMGDEMGEDMPEEFDEVVDRLEAGEDPESIESSLPDPGESSFDDGDDPGDF